MHFSHQNTFNSNKGFCTQKQKHGCKIREASSFAHLETSHSRQEAKEAKGKQKEK